MHIAATISDVTKRTKFRNFSVIASSSLLKIPSSASPYLTVPACRRNIAAGARKLIHPCSTAVALPPSACKGFLNQVLVLLVRQNWELVRSGNYRSALLLQALCHSQTDPVQCQADCPAFHQ